MRNSSFLFLIAIVVLITSCTNQSSSIGDIQEATVNASQSGMDFTGPMVGFYASSNGQQATNKAIFDWFWYEAK